ncbi:hypothetical protein O3M35_000293 [Rhynocoris fuscipes]|uniref:BRCT domain-containing protein n=1 Tax=Rhynocoris fuscipes TaxID=488301 RepID=A0AAW1DSA2_9HEMI
MSSEESDDGILKCLEDSGSEFEPSGDESDESFNLTDEDTPNTRGKKTNKAAKNEKAKTPKNDSAKKKKNINTDGARTRDSSQNSPPKKKVVLASVQAFKKREERPFNQLMNGVVFAMSGYENPLRSELRNKALAMGARYEFNWNCNCTHLICAFRNTPKYNQVRGRGKIVKSQWIEECYSRRKRLPWRRFALDRNDASQAESEEEICEKIESPVATTCQDVPESEGDTDDEIEKVRQKQQRINGSNNIDTPSTSGLNVHSTNDSTSEIIANDNDATADDAMDVEPTPNKVNNVLPPKVKTESNQKEETNVYDMDTESEDENYWVKTKPEENFLPPLPAFLEGATIALLDDLSDSDKNLLRRYIKAHKGSVADSKADLNMILYAITEDLSAIERVKEDFPQVMGVTPEWIWRSHDEAKLLPASQFQIK